MGTLIRDMPESVYHADPCETPSLSSSIARVLVDKSPLHAHAAHPRLGAQPRESTDTLDRGSLIHKLVLGKGAEIVTVNADDWRTKAAREQRDEARANGRIPVLVGVLGEAVAAAHVIRQRLEALGVQLIGESEVTCTWQEHTQSGPIWCRARFDHLIEGDIYDLKSSINAHPRACTRHVINYGYDIQRAAYLSALRSVRPDLAGRSDVTFLFVETAEPYASTVATLDAVLKERGERLWRQACETWAHCLRTNRWPGYASEPVRLEAPGWLMGELEVMG